MGREGAGVEGWRTASIIISITMLADRRMGNQSKRTGQKFQVSMQITENVLVLIDKLKRIRKRVLHNSVVVCQAELEKVSSRNKHHSVIEKN